MKAFQLKILYRAMSLFILFEVSMLPYMQISSLRKENKILANHVQLTNKGPELRGVYTSHDGKGDSEELFLSKQKQSKEEAAEIPTPHSEVHQFVLVSYI